MASRAPQEHERLGFEAYQPVLNQVHAIVPPGLVITLLADRGFVHKQLFHSLQKLQWHFRLRLPSDTLVHLEVSSISAVKDLCPPAGEQRFFQQVSILGAAVGPVSLALACQLEQPDDPWFVVSDEQTSARTLDEYGLRFGIEETFRDEKSGGPQIQLSHLATPEAAFAPAPDPGPCLPVFDRPWGQWRSRPTSGAGSILIGSVV